MDVIKCGNASLVFNPMSDAIRALATWGESLPEDKQAEFYKLLVGVMEENLQRVGGAKTA